MQSLLYLRLKGAEVGERKDLAREVCNLFLTWFKYNNQIGAVGIEFVQTNEYKILQEMSLNIISLECGDITVYLDYNPLTNELTM
jgi:hypothetical protein